MYSIHTPTDIYTYTLVQTAHEYEYMYMYVCALTGGDVKEAVLVLVSLRAPADALRLLARRYQLLARTQQ